MSGIFDAGYDRLAAAATGIPDCVPFSAQMHEFAMAWTGRTTAEFYTNAELMMDSLWRTAVDFEFDIPSLGYDVYNIEAEALGQRIVCHPGQAPAVDSVVPLLANENNLAHLDLPVPGTSARMPFVLDLQRRYRQRTGHRAGIQFCAPFTLAALIRGYDRFIEDILTNEGFARDLLTLLTEEVIAPWIRFQEIELPGAPVATGADALCSPPMVNGQIISEFSIPYIQKLRTLVATPVSVVNWWGDSTYHSLEEFLGYKRRVAHGLLRAQDPDVAALGPEPFKEYAERHNLVLELGVGDLLLSEGPEAAIDARIARYIQAAAPRGRFVLYLCSLDAATPPAHVRAAVKAIRNYGPYRN